MSKRLLFCLLITLSPLSFAGNCMPHFSGPQCPKNCAEDICCGKMGGISYCDASSGRFVCNNGFNSSCYCTRHAVMDLQRLEGCCLWQGGVLATTVKGIVLCNDGSISAICSVIRQDGQVAAY